MPDQIDASAGQPAVFRAQRDDGLAGDPTWPSCSPQPLMLEPALPSAGRSTWRRGAAADAPVAGSADLYGLCLL